MIWTIHGAVYEGTSHQTTNDELCNIRNNHKSEREKQEKCLPTYGTARALEGVHIFSYYNIIYIFFKYLYRSTYNCTLPELMTIVADTAVEIADPDRNAVVPC